MADQTKRKKSSYVLSPISRYVWYCTLSKCSSPVIFSRFTNKATFRVLKIIFTVYLKAASVTGQISLECVSFFFFFFFFASVVQIGTCELLGKPQSTDLKGDWFQHIVVFRLTEGHCDCSTLSLFVQIDKFVRENSKKVGLHCSGLETRPIQREVRLLEVSSSVYGETGKKTGIKR